MHRQTFFLLCLASLTIVGLMANIISPQISMAADSPVAVDKSSPAYDVKNTTRLQWVDPNGRQPITYAEWQAQSGIRGPLEVKTVSTGPAMKSGADGVGFNIFVDASLFSALESALDLFALDLTGEGYSVTTVTVSGGSPDSFRALLQSYYATGMEGCLLVGDLPVPWYENIPEPAEFPCDLYYMDLDGVFTDTDSDGMLDSHVGDVAPEIFVGRLTASPMTLGGADEIDLLLSYFEKNHRYRCGLMPVDNRALVYVDDDWAGPGWSFDMAGSYSQRTTEYDRWTTWAPDYMNRLPQDYEFIGVFVHSWPGGHGFKDPAENWSWVYNYDIKAIEPRAHFYNLFACSNARYVESDYCAGWYIFGPDHGLASVGSAKTGSMLNFQDFYDPFGEGMEIGRAFMEWFTAQAAGWFAQWEIDWFYGMTLCGDPTLRAQKKSNSGLLRFDDGSAAYMVAFPDPTLDLFNVRFTSDQPCTLTSVQAVGIFPEIPVRMYIWNSNGVYPTTVIDSMDIPNGELGLIDVSDRNLVFEAGVDFHIGFSVLAPAPAETLWIYMDNGQNMPEQRSGLKHDGQWKTNVQYWGMNYNFLIRAEIRYPDQPQVIITTLTLPGGTAGGSYSQPLNISGASPPYTWDITAGIIPDGLTLDPSTGLLSGVPASAGEFHFTVRATDGGYPAVSDVQPFDFSFTWVCGDANCDAQVNVADAVYIINYVFKGGPPPAVAKAGDANCDGEVNVADGVYLINYVFKAGPPPCCQ